MIASQISARLAPPARRFLLLVHLSGIAIYKSSVFCGLRTLFTLLPSKISRNPSRISRLRTLAKITEGCPLLTFCRRPSGSPFGGAPELTDPKQGRLPEQRACH